MNGRNHNLHNFFSALGVAFLTLGVGATVACDAMDGAEARQYSEEGSAGDTDTDGGDEGCTLTQGFWKNHNIYADNKSQQQAWPVSEDTLLCDQSWHDILQLAPKGNTWLVVAHQYIAAQLNVAAGAAVTVEVSAALEAAEGYLSDCQITKAEKADALLAKDLLDAFNNGLVGPGHCDDSDPTPETTGGETTGGETTGGDTTDTGGTECLVDCGTTTDPLPDPIPG
jgi:hypothetical protein